MKVKELLNSAEKWTKRTQARDIHGNPVRAKDSTAVCFCLFGAFHYCYSNEDGIITYSDDRKLDKLISTVREYTKHIDQSDIFAFNDNPNTTFEDIQKVLELTDI